VFDGLNEVCWLGRFYIPFVCPVENLSKIRCGLELARDLLRTCRMNAAITNGVILGAIIIIMDTFVSLRCLACLLLLIDFIGILS